MFYYHVDILSSRSYITGCFRSYSSTRRRTSGYGISYGRNDVTILAQIAMTVTYLEYVIKCLEIQIRSLDIDCRASTGLSYGSCLTRQNGILRDIRLASLVCINAVEDNGL